MPDRFHAHEGFLAWFLFCMLKLLLPHTFRAFVHVESSKQYYKDVVSLSR